MIGEVDYLLLLKICSKCGSVMASNTYFNGYICNECKWKDDLSYQNEQFN